MNWLSHWDEDMEEFDWLPTQPATQEDIEKRLPDDEEVDALFGELFR